MMQQMMQSPMAQAMLSNPELLRGMMTANPQVRQMVSLSLHPLGRSPVNDLRLLPVDHAAVRHHCCLSIHSPVPLRLLTRHPCL